MWNDVSALVEAMRTGQRAWGVPAYNGALFAPDGFDGAEILEVASISDAYLAPALIALARDPDHADVGIDFSGLEIGHLGHIYEGLLSLRLSVADRDFRYDARDDRYVPAAGEEVEITQGDLLWLTNEGGRKGAGVYYTRTELVRHLVREAVRPAFEQHLTGIRELAGTDPKAAAKQLFEFFVLDPACGSGHFLVEVVEELADQIAHAPWRASDASHPRRIRRATCRCHHDLRHRYRRHCAAQASRPKALCLRRGFVSHGRRDCQSLLVARLIRPWAVTRVPRP
jgi:hypothetical protein